MNHKDIYDRRMRISKEQYAKIEAYRKELRGEMAREIQALRDACEALGHIPESQFRGTCAICGACITPFVPEGGDHPYP